jgi:hypothetical protein
MSEREEVSLGLERSDNTFTPGLAISMRTEAG